MKPYRPLLSMIAVLLTACTGLASQHKGIPVSIHGVNHTDRPFRYVLIDPKDPDNHGGGEHIGPFGAGGIVCCYTLPKQWTPGMQVQVRATHWERFDANGKLPEITQVYTVEVPRYVDGDPAELWVLRTREGAIELVSSNVQPDHPAWPGTLKGWPEPSIVYQRERWELYLRLADDNVKLYEGFIADLQRGSRSHLAKKWESDKEHFSDEIRVFTGPDDPAYATYLRSRYAAGLARSKARLAVLLKEKP